MLIFKISCTLYSNLHLTTHMRKLKKCRNINCQSIQTKSERWQALGRPSVFWDALLFKGCQCWIFQWRNETAESDAIKSRAIMMAVSALKYTTSLTDKDNPWQLKKWGSLVYWFKPMGYLTPKAYYLYISRCGYAYLRLPLRLPRLLSATFSPLVTRSLHHK